MSRALPRLFFKHLYADHIIKEQLLKTLTCTSPRPSLFSAIMPFTCCCYYRFAQLQAAQAEARQLLRRARQLLAVPELCVFVSVDLEWSERDPDLVTELGWTLWHNTRRSIWSKHYIVKGEPCCSSCLVAS